MDAVEKFQTLLQALFQFDSSELDFGIYRILNFKRDEIRKFIQKDLKDTVEKAFAKHKDERLANIGLQLEDAKQKVIQALGTGAVLAAGELKGEFRETPVGRDYLAIKAQKEEAETIDQIKLQVFNDLYSFFARYYEEGDFVPQYRYSIKNHKYAIPYNGEEVKLYWANWDQYYTKTGILFRDYAFFTDAGKTFKVIFRTVAAKEELGSNKATKARFFILDDDNQWKVKDGNTIVIRLQYRELSSGEVKKYGVEGGSNASKQEKINGKIHEAVTEGVKETTLKAFLAGPYKNDKPLFLYQLGRFTAKNTKDYFIHKNLKKFLSEQLDYFIKAEVISLETLEKERFFDKHITRAKVVREIGEKIIDFLSQIEDFQKKLWEKKKFVLKTEYVITTDRVPEELYHEILKNKVQAKEWKELGFEVAKLKPKLKDMKLPIDTKHFPEEFKERLLERLTENADLDDLLEGLLIKSENWQGLNLIRTKYAESIDWIYIDPPYNTGEDGFLYKDSYQSSSWISMLRERLHFGVIFLRREGIHLVSIGKDEYDHLNLLLNDVFPIKNIPFVWKSRAKPTNTGDAIYRPQIVAEFVLMNSKKLGVHYSPLDSGEVRYYPHQDEHGKYRITTILTSNRGRYRRETMRFEIPGYKPPEEKRWKAGYEEILNLFSNHRIGFGEEGEPYHKVYEGDEKESHIPLWTFLPEEITGTAESGKSDLSEILGGAHGLDSVKPKELISIFLSVIGRKGIILDYFAGSGTTAHAVMSLNSEDGGKRKFILVEMAHYFDAVIIPRLKKVAYSFNWRDGKPQDSEGVGVFFKYQYIEQYEDALDNLELAPDKTAQKHFGDDYLLKYFLDFETKDNPSLLNIEHLKKPFSYKLKVNLEEVGEPQEVVVDIPETFHYLLGFKMNKVKVRKNKGKKYHFILGEKESRTIAVVWREYDDEWTQTDFKKDKEFIMEELGPWSPQIVYVNGQSVLTPKLGEHVVEIRSIEPEFKALMVNSL
jgi:adenine-specific DNA-methyltransferase